MMDKELRSHIKDLLESGQREGASRTAFDCLLNQRECSPLILRLQEVQLGLKAAELVVEAKVVRGQWEVRAYQFIHDLFGSVSCGCVGGSVLQRECVCRLHHLERPY
jgi:hypothetical protein